eukprot:Rmarinus@m.7059
MGGSSSRHSDSNEQQNRQRPPSSAYPGQYQRPPQYANQPPTYRPQYHQQPMMFYGQYGSAGRMQVMHHPRPPPPPPSYVQQNTTTIVNPANMKRRSLNTHAISDRPGVYSLDFLVDLSAASTCTVYFSPAVGQPDLSSGKCPMMSPDGAIPPRTFPLQRGLRQKIALEGDDAISIPDLIAKTPPGPPTPTPVHIAICLDCPEPRATQCTFISFSKQGTGGKFSAKVVGQHLHCNGSIYELQDIFGIESDGGGSADDPASGSECVICLTDPRNMAVLPCRHLCLCQDCAKTLGTQSTGCPVCRGPVQAFLKLEMKSAPPAVHEPVDLTNATAVGAPTSTSTAAPATAPSTTETPSDANNVLPTPTLPNPSDAHTPDSSTTLATSTAPLAATLAASPSFPSAVTTNTNSTAAATTPT